MVVGEAPPWVALAIASMVVALASTGVMAARRRAAVPLFSWVAFAFVVALVVFALGMVGFSWARAFFLSPGSL
jgi:hypothetical protein